MSIVGEEVEVEGEADSEVVRAFAERICALEKELLTGRGPAAGNGRPDARGRRCSVHSCMFRWLLGEWETGTYGDRLAGTEGGGQFPQRTGGGEVSSG